MTAIDAMKTELTTIEQLINECTTDYGHVRSECRYKYQMLVRKARAFQESIAWMEAQKGGNYAVNKVSS